jgi:hypothetical protein
MGLEVPHFIEQVEKNSKLSLTVGDEVLALSYGGKIPLDTCVCKLGGKRSIDRKDYFKNYHSPGVYADYTTLSTHVLIYNHIIYLGKKLHGFQDLA